VLYDALAGAAPGAVVEVNRAVAHGRAYGATAGMAVLDRIDSGGLGDSPILPSVRGDLLERAGRHAEAASEFAEAAGRSRNAAERSLLRRRAEENRERTQGEPPPG
jgi:predicted RNA polymerase sigma factor